MNCFYCGAQNHEEEHRCRRCGRRLHIAKPRPAPDTYPVVKTSPVRETQPEERGPVIVGPEEPPVRPRPAHQPWLFPGQETPRVIPFQPLAGERKQAPRRRQSDPADRPSRRTRTREHGNLELGFASPEELSSAAASVRSFLFGYARAAAPMHRSLAAVLDLSMILIASGLFLVTFHLAGGELVVNHQTIPFYVTVPLAIALIYELFWSIAGGATAGMRWTKLRLLNFDGRPPTLRQRLCRVAGTAVSIMAIGLGLLWAFFDEENLAWQDHISKTFPTPL